MVFPEPSSLRRDAKAAVAKDKAAALRLVAVHSAVPALLSLVLTALNYYLSLQIADTGGLDGLGTRSFLESLQTVLQIGNLVFAVFWGMSYVAIVSRWARGEGAVNADLMLGFRHFGPVLRANLLKAAIVFAISFLAAQVSSVIYAMSPAMEPHFSMFESMMTDPGFLPTDAQMESFALSYLPFFVIALVVALIPVSYRLRLMEFSLMEHPEKGAFYALRESMALTRHNCRKLFKMDLGFWWFYALEALTVVLYYGDWILALMGVETWLSPEALLLCACVAGLLSQTALYIWHRNQVQTAYALLYQHLKPKNEEN